MNEAREATLGDALVDQLCYLGVAMRDRIWDALHISMKWAMTVIYSGFTYDMEVVSHGFVSDITKTDTKNEERHYALVDDTEEPTERLAKLFEPDVLALRSMLVTRNAMVATTTEAYEPYLGIKARVIS